MDRRYHFRSIQCPQVVFHPLEPFTPCHLLAAAQFLQAWDRLAHLAQLAPHQRPAV